MGIANTIPNQGVHPLNVPKDLTLCTLLGFMTTKIVWTKIDRRFAETFASTVLTLLCSISLLPLLWFLIPNPKRVVVFRSVIKPIVAGILSMIFHTPPCHLKHSFGLNKQMLANIAMNIDWLLIRSFDHCWFEWNIP